MDTKSKKSAHVCAGLPLLRGGVTLEAYSTQLGEQCVKTDDIRMQQENNAMWGEVGLIALSK